MRQSGGFAVVCSKNHRGYEYGPVLSLCQRQLNTNALEGIMTISGIYGGGGLAAVQYRQPWRNVNLASSEMDTSQTASAGRRPRP